MPSDDPQGAADEVELEEDRGQSPRTWVSWTGTSNHQTKNILRFIQKYPETMTWMYMPDLHKAFTRLAIGEGRRGHDSAT